MDGWLEEWTDRWTDSGKDAWMVGWMDGMAKEADTFSSLWQNERRNHNFTK